MALRLVVDGAATLREIREEWTYPDALKANAILDMRADMETAMEAMARADSERPPKGARG